MTELSRAKLSVVGLKAYYFANKGVVKAVDNITFAIGENESLGIAGESACGKSHSRICPPTSIATTWQDYRRKRDNQWNRYCKAVR